MALLLSVIRYIHDTSAVSLGYVPHLGVEPVFIAPSKPGMNGMIGDFDGDNGCEVVGPRAVDRSEHIRGEAKIFLMRHNTSPGLEDRKTDPDAIPHRKLPEDFEIGANSLPIMGGKCTLSDR